MAKQKRIWKCLLCVLLGLCVLMTAAALMLYALPSYHISRMQKEADIPVRVFIKYEDRNRLHFLNTGNSDCILVESNGHFALVDAGEDSDNPRNFPALELTGYEERVIAYLKKVAADENGKVTLDWVLGTHMHSDHIGGFDSILADPDITVKKAFLQEYREEWIIAYEVRNWDNKEVYTQMLEACNVRGVEVISRIPSEPWQFEAFTVQFFNTERILDKQVGENENAVGTKLTANGKNAFLSADINNLQGAEKTIAPMIGQVDLLKVGHHGHPLSTTFRFAQTLRPAISIVTNGTVQKVNPFAKFALAELANSKVYSTGDNNGLIADFSGENITLSNQLHPAD